MDKMNIYQAISKCMDDIGAVGKNDVNSTQGFKYRGIDAIMNAINPALVKNHIFIVPEILEQTREERTSKKGVLLIYSICKIRYTFYAEDGSSVSAVVIGEGMDSGDKATNKAMAIAFKYACFQVFCIPTKEMDDPDAETHEVAEKSKPLPATVEQLQRLMEFSDAYAELEERNPSEIWNILRKKFNFSHTGDIDTEKADLIIKQLETWYKKKKES